jgi:hypothetical protein
MFSQMWQNKFILGEVPLFGGGVFTESSVNCDGGGGGSGSGVGIVGGGGLLSWEMSNEDSDELAEPSKFPSSLT